ncbi:MAG: phosphoribosyl-ATP diphosphatase [Alphaproteobacteria bacterium]|jgi:phosphoribosyl-ATP pyrophosphohydrolase|nr:phosphoribosyl-ATP diphosphatase [Rhodobiaceae bacterium]RPF85587.1 MAG: phosphoribosyl-ATP diphosphatase [Rhizobiales bacterium TMED94]
MSEKQNILDELWLIIEEKSVGDDESSYTKTMLNKDINYVARKMGEEAIETIVAAIGQTKKDTVNESADLIYHWLLLMKKLDIKPEEIYQELKNRMSL